MSGSLFAKKPPGASLPSGVEPPVTGIPSHLVEHEDDENDGQPGYIKGTDYSTPYSSPWSRIHEPEIQEGLLRHMNCSYLSATGAPPTLLALKQHAQSLCILIQALNPTLKSAEILAGDPTKPPKGTTASIPLPTDPLALKYQRNDAFDFLSDLTTPYTNADPNHHKPLTGLLNEVRTRHETTGITNYHCPLIGAASSVKQPPPGSESTRPIRPYANHHNLVMHANSCLERLDHEFSTVGGLMGLLPTDAEHDSGDLAKARTSLLGQWLLFTQHLVGRMHELERAYGNAIDALSGEAAIPRQYLGSLGVEGRAAGREVAYPQDRWVLVNAGEDVFGYVHDVLDQREKVLQARERVWRKNGVAGDGAWATEEGETEVGKDGREYARGIVPATIPTRFYRLAGQGRNTLFVIPAWEVHPGVEYMRELESKPTVVGCIQPVWPKRVSDLEQKHLDKFEKVGKMESENRKMREEAIKTHDQLRTLKNHRDYLNKTREALLHVVDGEGKGKGKDKDATLKLAAQVQDVRIRAERAEQTVRELNITRDAAVEDVARLTDQLERVLQENLELKEQVAAAEIGKGDKKATDDDGDVLIV